MTAPRGASLANLQLRAKLLAAARHFFSAADVLEIETPAFSLAATTDPQLESFMTRWTTNKQRYFLQTSPELYMKRLLADGSGDIYQICRVFRDNEVGRWHEPEFTLLEWYRVGWDEQQLIREVDELLRKLLHGHYDLKAAEKFTYSQVIENSLGVPADSDAATLAIAINEQGISTPENIDSDGLLDLAVSTLACRSFAIDRATFIYDYPASQAALARIDPQRSDIAKRFEVFIGAIEIGNGFHELTDPIEQLNRFANDNTQRFMQGKEKLPIDNEFIESLRRGLPSCAGVAVGFDRLVAIAAGASAVHEVVAFSHAIERDH